MSQGQEIRLPLEEPGASPEAGSYERQKANLLREEVEQSLRDMDKSAQTLRDVPMSAQSSEDSRNQVLIEYEEGIAAIQLDPQSHTYALGDGSSALPTSSDSHSLSRDKEKQTNGEQGIGIASERSNSNWEEDNTIPGLKLGEEKGEDPKLRRPPLPPQPNTPPAAALPLHLIPLVSPKSSPPNRRRTSIDPSTTINGEDAIDLQQGRGNLHNATGETTFASQSDLWHFQTRATAGSPVISRTLAYAMGRTQIVGSSHRPIPLDAEVDRREEEGTRPKLGREEKSARKITPSTVEVGRIRETIGDMMTVAEDTFEDQDRDGAEIEIEIEIEEMDIHGESAWDGVDDPVIKPQGMKLAQSQPEGKYNRLMKQEMEIREAKQKAEILEETLQAREKDLCNRLETVRQKLQVIRLGKTLIERREDSLRQKLADARREQGLEEDSEPRDSTTQEIQRARAEVEADVPPEESSHHCTLSKLYSPTSTRSVVDQSSVS